MVHKDLNKNWPIKKKDLIKNYVLFEMMCIQKAVNRHGYRLPIWCRYGLILDSLALMNHMHIQQGLCL